MARAKNETASRYHHIRLTGEEFASLKEVGKRPMERTIPDAHRDRLIKAGYVREVVRSVESVSALALTGRGLQRLALGE